MKTIALLLCLLAIVASQTQIPVQVVQTAQFTGDRLSQKPTIYLTKQSPTTQNVINLNANQQFQTVTLLANLIFC